MRKIKSAIIGISGLSFLVLVWQIISSLNLLEPTLFPSPTNTFLAFSRLFLHNNLLKEIIYTLQRVFSGFLIAAVLGVLIGLVIGINKLFSKSFAGVIDFFRSIPVVTLYPIFILLFGINDEAKIAMTFWATIWIVTLNAIYGVKQSIEIRKDVAKVYGANKIQCFKWITLYEALPQIMVGMRIAISYALLAEIMCEMFMGSNFGIGQKIYESNVKLSAPELFALVAVTGLLGILINRMFVLLERKLIPWAGKL